jgi:aminoglycoside/choline kinase family phosphotransferase
MHQIEYHNPDIIHTYYLMISDIDSNQFRVLLKQEGDHWTLPNYQPKEHHFAVVQHINHTLKQEYGLDVATLRCFRTEYDSTFGERRFYALDNLNHNWQPPANMRWVSEDIITNLNLPSDLQRDTILKWFDWIHSDNSIRVPWMRHGWFNKVSHWLIDLADRMAMDDIGEIEQLRTWSRSATLRLKTGHGDIYLKAVPEMFTYEPVITRVLSLRYPNHAPDVRAVHVDKGWMVMRDFGGQTLTRVQDLEVWKKAVREYARMQLDISGNTQSLVALGVPDRNIDYMASQIERMMHHLPDDLTHEEQVELKRLSSTLKGMCYELVEYNIPLTLTHGDFWSGNTIIKNNGDILFFDWSDASISHPFFDIAFFLTEIETEIPHRHDAREQILNAYLEQWTRYEPMANLRQAYALAQVLGSLHQALFYFIHILPGIEFNARWEMQSMLPYLLRQIIAGIRIFNSAE